MQVDITVGEGLNRVLKITIPHQEVEASIEKEIVTFSKEAKITGFRPGKVPASYIRKRYGDSIRKQEVARLMEANIDAAFRQENLDVASIISVDTIRDEVGKNLEYKAEVEIYPDTPFKDLSSVTIPDYQAEITDEDVTYMLNKLREQRAEWNAVERAAKEGDRVTIDFEGFIDGQPFKGNQSQNQPLIIGSKTMLPGFEEGIIKHKKGDNFKVNIEFPHDYPSAEVAGKKAEFNIQLHEVTERKIPELNDEFAKELGYEEKGVAGLTEAMKADMQNSLTHHLYQKVKQAVTDTLTKINDVAIPHSLLQRAQQQHKSQMAKQRQITQFSDAFLRKMDEDVSAQLRRDILLRHFIKLHKLTLDEKRFHKIIGQAISNSPYPQEMLQYLMKDKNKRAEFEHMALEEQVIDRLLESAKREKTNLTYKQAHDIED